MRTTRLHPALALPFAAALVSCGAKSALWTPCEIELVPSTPEVIVVVDRSSGEGTCGEDPVQNGTADFPCLRYVAETLGVALPALDAAANTGLYIFPEIGVEALLRDGVCTAPPDLAVPIAARNVQPILTEIARGNGGDWHYFQHRDQWPFGGAPLHAALAIAARTFRSTPPPGPRFVILSTSTLADCNPDIARSECECFAGDTGSLPLGACPERDDYPLSCSDERRVLADVQALRSNDIRTMVISRLRPGILPESHANRIRTTLAEAGGLARPGIVPWFSVEEPEVIADAIRTRIVPSGWCEPRLASPIAAREDWFLTSRARGEVSFDPTHRDGWDWIEVGTTIRLYGTACDQAMADRAGLAMVSRTRHCAR